MNTKQKVLLTLEKNKGAPISGGELAKQLEISRTAIWKAISSLKEEGYDISSQSGKGYVLATTSDILQAEGILAYLKNKVPLHVYEQVDSTNKVATKLVSESPPHGTTVVAGHQTHGRGRRGRSFFSPKDTGIYMTMILHPKNLGNDPIAITTAASVAVAKAISQVSNVTPSIKWVNDIYVEGKKVCGILTEGITDFETGQINHIILGIGINCFTTHFPKEAGGYPGSIMGDFSKNQLTAAIMDNVYHIFDQGTSTYMDYYRDHSMVLGKNITVYKQLDSPGEKGMALSIDEYGGLVVAYEDGTTETLRTGEITIRIGE